MTPLNFDTSLYILITDSGSSITSVTVILVKFFLDDFFIKFKLVKTKIFEDPKLLAFYSWMKARLLKKKLYAILLKEYEEINE